MARFYCLIFIISLFFNIPLYAENDSLTPIQKIKNEILEKLENLKKRNISEWYKNLEELSSLSDYYISEQEKECSGDFSYTTKNEEGDFVKSTKVLSQPEKRQCLLDLIRFRRIFISEIYNLRVKALKGEYDKRLQTLEEQKKSLLDELAKISTGIK